MRKDAGSGQKGEKREIEQNDIKNIKESVSKKWLQRAWGA